MKRVPWLLLALVGLGGVFFLFTRIGLNYKADKTTYTDDLRPDAYLSEYRIQFFNPAGQLYLNLAGAMLTHQSKTRMNQADDPKLYHITPDGQRWDMEATRAAYPFSGYIFTLDGGVRVSQFNPKTRVPDLMLTTDNLVYFPHTRRVVTSSPVKLESAEAQLSVTGIEGFLDERRFILPAQVRGVYRYD